MKKKGSHFQPRFLFFALVAVCVALLIVSSFNSTVNNAARSVVNTVLMPMQNGLNSIGSRISGGLESLAELQSVQEENEQLQEEIALLREENTRYQLQLEELEEYQELLEMKEQYPDYETIGAHVIGTNSSNWDKTVLIDRGSNDGIEVNMNVVSQGGLVGLVVSVTSDSSTVRLIIDQDCSVGGMALESQDTCIVTGSLDLEEDGLLLLSKIDKDADLEDDDKIVTSNTSSVYLPGILIGYAKDLEVDSNSLTKSGYLVPVVDFDHLDSVLVITTLKETGEE